MGKGSTRRPCFVDSEKFSANWNQTFKSVESGLVDPERQCDAQERPVPQRPVKLRVIVGGKV